MNPSVALVRLVNSIAWELRTLWAGGRRVSLAIDGDDERVEGWVSSVSATGAFVVIGDLHVPLDRVLAVYRPSRLGDSEFVEGERWGGRVPAAARRDPNQLELPGL